MSGVWKGFIRWSYYEPILSFSFFIAGASLGVAAVYPLRRNKETRVFQPAFVKNKQWGPNEKPNLQNPLNMPYEQLTKRVY